MKRETLNGVVIDERVELTLHDLSHACACSSEWVLQLVDEGVIEPRQGDRRELRSRRPQT
jgi:chaperone modulatory protein CbpM